MKGYFSTTTNGYLLVNNQNGEVQKDKFSISEILKIILKTCKKKWGHLENYRKKFK